MKKIKLSTKEKKELRTLGNKCARLWRQVVRLRFGNKCVFPGCKKVKFLNAHHVESYATNQTLRHDPMNGILGCPTHHKFGRQSAHRSFIFMYKIMVDRPIQLQYLLDHHDLNIQITKEYLIKQIEKLQGEINEAKNPHKQRRKIIK